MYSRCNNINGATPCKYEPIVLPVRERVCNRFHTVEQPIICPVNTRIVHHYSPRPVYYPAYTVTEETACGGTTNSINQTMVNPFGTNATNLGTTTAPGTTTIR